MRKARFIILVTFFYHYYFIIIIIVIDVVTSFPNTHSYREEDTSENDNSKNTGNVKKKKTLDMKKVCFWYAYSKLLKQNRYHTKNIS